MTTSNPKIDQLNIVFFDGYCNLCSASVDFLLKADKHKKLKFSPIQSEFGSNFLKEKHLGKDSVVFYIENEVYTKSSAVLRILGKLGFFWKILYLFLLVPPFIRNAIYNYISKNRFKWFGERKECYKPSIEHKQSFIY